MSALELPAGLREAAAPPARRDDVRLLVAGAGPLRHVAFGTLPRHLHPGDLLVVNTSATLPAALAAIREDGTPVALHLSTPSPGPHPPARATITLRWVVELRSGGARVRDGAAGETLALPGGATARLVEPYLSPGRLWVADLTLGGPLLPYLHAHGAPIAYAHLAAPRPLADHQTIFARHPGSAEMPSAGRPFTRATVRALHAEGVAVAPVTLHTGVSSQERGELPYPERFAVPAATAARVNAAHAGGNRVIAVGTTVVRALESAADGFGRVAAGRGWTDLVVTPAVGVRAVDGLLTGFHDPDASHLQLLTAVAGEATVARAYAAAAEWGYARHEFGDSNLLLRPAV